MVFTDTLSTALKKEHAELQECVRHQDELIAVLWAVLGPQLQDLLQEALNKAKGSVPG